MTFGDIKPNENFINSSIQLLTDGGATAKVTVEGLGTVWATFSYWDEDDASDGAGWYLDADEDAEYNQNSRVIPFGDSYLVNRPALVSPGKPGDNSLYSGKIRAPRAPQGDPGRLSTAPWRPAALPRQSPHRRNLAASSASLLYLQLQLASPTSLSALYCPASAATKRRNHNPTSTSPPTINRGVSDTGRQ